MVGLIDFDDANYTYLIYDVANFLDYYARMWPLDDGKARSLLKEYMKHRPLSAPEQRHLFDALKLSVLVDSLWFFHRYERGSFREKRKIDYLNSLGREGFRSRLFA